MTRRPRNPMVLLSGLLVASCTPASPRPNGEAVRDFVDLVSSPALAPESCLDLPLGVLRQDCLDMAAKRRAETAGVEAGLAACALHEAESFWQSECVFAVVDAAELVGAEAVQHCVGAGPLRRRCVGHALRRTVAAELKPLRLGEEPAQMAAATQAARALVPPKKARIATREATVELLRERVGTVLERAHCGAADPVLCAEAYRAAVLAALTVPGKDSRETAPQAMARVCPAPVSMAAATAEGFPGWDAQAEAVVQQAWATLCAEAADPTLEDRRRGNAAGRLH